MVTPRRWALDGVVWSSLFRSRSLYPCSLAAYGPMKRNLIQWSSLPESFSMANTREAAPLNWGLTFR